MRLDYLIANATALSRRDAKRAIGQGRVQVDGAECRQASIKLSEQSTVTLDGQPVVLADDTYLMLHKPAGVVSATIDSHHTTALDLLPGELRAGVHIVGRLDQDTTGLLLLTTDGQWSHRITSPRSACDKTYRVTLAESITAEAIEQLKTGVMLKDDPEPTRPAQVQPLSDTMIELTIQEGRYHQVKRMLAAVGNRVVALHRQRIGAIELDAALGPGEYRALTEDEVASVV